MLPYELEMAKRRLELSIHEQIRDFANKNHVSVSLVANCEVASVISWKDDGTPSFVSVNNSIVEVDLKQFFR